MINRLNYLELNSKAVNGLAAVNKHVASIDEGWRAMLELRISQFNGCVYCVDLHAEQARAAGETQQRIDCITVWQECEFFDAAERASLGWVEAITLLPDTNAPDDLYNALAEHYSDEQIVDLTFIASLMNAWNRLAVSFRHLPEARD